MKTLFAFLMVSGLATGLANAQNGYPLVREINLFNTTDYPLEELAYWTCQYLGIKEVFIRIDYLPDHYRERGMAKKIYDKAYQINLKKNLGNVKLILIHELIHVKQYESGDLKSMQGSFVEFKGRQIDLERVDYMERDFEFEAHAQDGRVLQAYRKQLKLTATSNSCMMAKDTPLTPKKCL